MEKRIAFSNEIGVFFSLWKDVAGARSKCVNGIPKIVTLPRPPVSDKIKKSR
jgi:hypothetical protein